MAGDFFPRKDGNFVQFSSNLRRLIVADAQAYGLSEERAAQYAQLDDALSVAYRRATNKSTRTAGAVADKNTARAACEQALRKISYAVKGMRRGAGVTVDKVIALGLNPRDRGGRHAILRAPQDAPGVWIESAVGRRVTVRIFDKECLSRRRRPRGATSAMLFSFIGDEPEWGIDGWLLRGLVVQRKATIEFPSDLPPGARVWVRARWVSQAGGWGPLSSPIDTNLPGDRSSPRPRLTRLAA
jgi:hypothetical protein